MSNTPKLRPKRGELLEWIGEANLSRDENAVVTAVLAEAVPNAYAQWYDSHREASVKIAVRIWRHWSTDFVRQRRRRRFGSSSAITSLPSANKPQNYNI